jgi:hypothetical protein
MIRSSKAPYIYGTLVWYGGRVSAAVPVVFIYLSYICYIWCVEASALCTKISYFDAQCLCPQLVLPCPLNVRGFQLYFFFFFFSHLWYKTLHRIQRPAFFFCQLSAASAKSSKVLLVYASVHVDANIHVDSSNFFYNVEQFFFYHLLVDSSNFSFKYLRYRRIYSTNNNNNRQIGPMLIFKHNASYYIY